MIDRVHRELTDEEIQRLANTYYAWRGDRRGRLDVGAGKSADVPGFSNSATTKEVKSHG